MARSTALEGVVWSGGGSSSRRSNRAPRSLGTTGCDWEAIHAPTGVYVFGEVVRGHYGRAELTRLRDDLRTVVSERLLHEVAVATRAPGRGSSALGFIASTQR